jgi:protein-disulfide isomerase
MKAILRFLVTALAGMVLLGAASALVGTGTTPKPEPGVSFSTPEVDFRYQLLGTTSLQMAEVVTNSGTVPLVITALHVTGEDAADFAISSNFTLPVTILPGQSVTVNVTFAPGEPWTPGTRRARLKFTDNDGPQFVSLTGMGVNCGGPVPAVLSNDICADADGDGLNDAWEIAGGIDMNNDGKIDGQHDLLLPGADPNKQDVYVQYDWMDYSTPGNACSADADCTNISFGHFGETCSGPQVLPTASGSCRYACTVDSDCAARGSGHTNEMCVANSCVHTHDPDMPSPGPLQAVVDSFDAHGINLHLLRGHALPHSLVTSFRLNNEMSNTCEGASLAGGAVGMGKYAESLYDLKTSSSMDPLKIAYHYGLFAHYSGCDSFDHCNSCPYSRNPDGSFKNQPVAGQSGIAEISGNDFIVSLGGRFQDLRHDPGTFNVGSTFMHELGHNLGLRHGGGIDTPCKTLGAACPNSGICTQTPIGSYCLEGEDINAKPNYLSVMNYRYQFTGILSASAPGGTIPVSARLDYSEQTLPTGGNTPGYLDQSNVANSPAAGDPGLGLSEPAGLGSGRADLFTFTDARETGIPKMAASEGPVDWDGDGAFNKTNVQADTNCGPAGFGDHYCNAPQHPQLKGHTDWGPAGQNQFTYKFQGTPYGGPKGDGAAATLLPLLQHEMSTQMELPAPKMNVSYDKTLLRGMPEAQITIVEFTDFRCGFCRQAESTLKEVLAKYPSKVALAHKDYPLGGMDSQSALASGAARCAGEQGKFWEYHDLLLSSSKLDREILASYSDSLKLNAKEFDSCLAAERYKAAIEQDLKDGKMAGVSATPAFFINGVRVTGAQPASTFEKIIDQELDRLTRNSPGH